jgi:hypothetical protein
MLHLSVDAASTLCMIGKSATLALQDTKFLTSIGRGVFDAIFNTPKIIVSEQFLPRRTAFIYELDDDSFNSDIPTTLRRSKADCPPVSALTSIQFVPIHSWLRIPDVMRSYQGHYTAHICSGEQVYVLLICHRSRRH